VALTKRQADAGHIALLFNESWSGERAQFTLTRSGSRLTLWDPWTGEQRVLAEHPVRGDRFELEVGPVESWLLTMAPAASAGPDEGGRSAQSEDR